MHFRVLNALAAHPGASQRELAARLGVSLGRVNFCLRALAETGAVKVERFRNASSRQRYLVLLTPAGLAQRARSAQKFLDRKKAEYEALREEIERVSTLLNAREGDLS